LNIRGCHNVRVDEVAGNAGAEYVADALIETSSGGTRESMQPTIAAKGDWLLAVSLTCAIRSQLIDLPAVNRSFPTLRRVIASSGAVAF
jgi:hypothetical protein